MRRSRRGLTLVELLAAVAITAILAAVSFAVLGKYFQSAQMAAELAAGRTLVSAYLTAATDRDGVLLPGFDDQARGYTHPALGHVSDAASHRYPFRLAPYFDYGLQGVILVGPNASQIRRMGFPSWEYGVSLCPALGMNAYYVGGCYELGQLDMPEECATRLTQVRKPSSMLLFASAGMSQGSEKVDGFHRLEPPAKRVTLWTGGDEARDASSPEDYGHVDFRYNGQAVCAFLDGSVRLLKPVDLKDMRLWNKNAQDRDNPNYRVSVRPPPRPGGR